MWAAESAEACFKGRLKKIAGDVFVAMWSGWKIVDVVDPFKAMLAAVCGAMTIGKYPCTPLHRKDFGLWQNPDLMVSLDELANHTKLDADSWSVCRLKCEGRLDSGDEKADAWNRLDFRWDEGNQNVPWHAIDKWYKIPWQSKEGTKIKGLRWNGRMQRCFVLIIYMLWDNKYTNLRDDTQSLKTRLQWLLLD